MGPILDSIDAINMDSVIREQLIQVERIKNSMPKNITKAEKMAVEKAEKQLKELLASTNKSLTNIKKVKKNK